MEFAFSIASWWVQPVWKILVKLDHFPNFRGEHKKMFELPPARWGFQALKNLSLVQWHLTGHHGDWDAPIAILGRQPFLLANYQSSWNPTLLRALTSNQFGGEWSSNADPWWMVGWFFTTWGGMSNLRNERTDCKNIVVDSKPNFWRTLICYSGVTVCILFWISLINIPFQQGFRFLIAH